MNKKKNKNIGHTARPLEPTYKSQIGKTNPQKKSSNLNVDRVLLWVGFALCTLLIAVVFVLPKLLVQNNNVSEGDKFRTSMLLLQKQTNHKLASNWFHIAKTEEFTIQNPLYIDIARGAFIYDGDSIFYSKGADNNNIKISTSSITNATNLINRLEIKEEDNINDICTYINADSAYLIKINKNAKRNDKIFSLIYNTLIGDTSGHLYVTIEKGSLKIVRAWECDKLNIEKLYSTTKAIENKSIDVTGQDVQKVFQDECIIESNIYIPFAYLDYRNDCIRVAGEKMVPKERYKVLSNILIENPTTLYVYSADEDTLLALNDTILNNAMYSYGKADYSNLQSIYFEKKKDLLSYYGITSILILFLGLIEGVLLFALISKQKPRGIQPNVSEQNNINQLTIEDEVNTNKIREIINNNTDMEKEDVEKLNALLNQLYRESVEARQIKEEKEKYYKKYSNLNDILSKDFTLKELFEAILKDWGTIENLNKKLVNSVTSIIETNRKQALDEYKNTSNYQKQKEKSEKYDALLNCHSENTLLEKLENMRQESGGKMAAITTFNNIKKPTTTIRDVVELYDRQTRENLTATYEKMEGKVAWYDANRNSIVAPTANLKLLIPNHSNRQDFITGAINTLVIPAMGTDYKAKIEKFMKEYQNIENEAKAYRILLESKKDFNREGLNRKLASVIKEDDATWIGNLREAARRYTSINKFNDSMWEFFVKDFIGKEKYIEDDAEKGWYFTRLMEIAYHTADHIRSIKEEGNASLCHNVQLMANNMDLKKDVNEFSYENPRKYTKHSRTIYRWASELGVNHLKIVVDNFAIMP